MAATEYTPPPSPRWSKRLLLAGGVLVFLALTVLLLIFNPRRDGLSGPEKIRPAEEWVTEAEDALRVIPTPENRRARRPVGFDDVLRPVDGLLGAARTALAEADYDEAVRIGRDAARLAAEGLEQARSASGGARTQRFPDQIADAMQVVVGAYLAPLRGNPDRPGESPTPPSPALDETIRQHVRAGLEQRPTDRELLLLSAQLDQLSGRWPGAAKSLELVLEHHPDYAEAWNDLGLVRIMLRDNEGAEAAFGKAREFSRPESGAGPSATYRSATLNLAEFHANLAMHFRDLYARSGSADARREGARHRTRAAEAYADYLRGAPAETAERVRRELEALGAVEP